MRQNRLILIRPSQRLNYLKKGGKLTIVVSEELTDRLQIQINRYTVVDHFRTTVSKCQSWFSNV